METPFLMILCHTVTSHRDNPDLTWKQHNDDDDDDDYSTYSDDNWNKTYVTIDGNDDGKS